MGKVSKIALGILTAFGINSGAANAGIEINHTPPTVQLTQSIDPLAYFNDLINVNGIVLPSNRAESIVNSIVNIEILNKEGENRLSRGSGFFISKNVIVTNKHVLINEETGTTIENFQSAVEIEITNLYERKIEIDKIEISPNRDLAFIFIKGENSHYLKIRRFENENGLSKDEYFFNVGFSGNGNYTSKNGSTNYLDIHRGRYLGIEDEFQQFDLVADKGDSGGPVLNQNGDVVGVATEIKSLGSLDYGSDYPLWKRALGTGRASFMNKTKAIPLQELIAESRKIGIAPSFSELGETKLEQNPNFLSEIDILFHRRGIPIQYHLDTIENKSIFLEKLRHLYSEKILDELLQSSLIFTSREEIRLHPVNSHSNEIILASNASVEEWIREIEKKINQLPN